MIKLFLILSLSLLNLQNSCSQEAKKPNRENTKTTVSGEELS
jgi:hypothetical protein